MMVGKPEETPSMVRLCPKPIPVQATGMELGIVGTAPSSPGDNLEVLFLMTGRMKKWERERDFLPNRVTHELWDQDDDRYDDVRYVYPEGADEADDDLVTVYYFFVKVVAGSKLPDGFLAQQAEKIGGLVGTAFAAMP